MNIALQRARPPGLRAGGRGRRDARHAAGWGWRTLGAAGLLLLAWLPVRPAGAALVDDAETEQPTGAVRGDDPEVERRRSAVLVDDPGAGRQTGAAPVDDGATERRAGAPLVDDADAERRARRITVGAVGLVGLYGAAAWWSGNLSNNFRVRREGWFGRDTYAGGADKLGHGFSTYLGTRLFVRAYEAAGLSQERARDRAALAALATMMGVEVLDGFSKRFRFSPEDAVMNLSGVGMAWLLERHPELDRKLDFRVLYRRSAEAKAGSIWDPIEDTSGQTYLMAIKGAGFDALSGVPGARYFELLLGYGSRGYRPGAPGVLPSRHSYVGIGINLAELLGITVFDRGVPPSRTQRITNGVLEYLQVPGTTLLHDHQF